MPRALPSLLALALAAVPAAQGVPIGEGFHPDAQVQHVRARLAAGERADALAPLVAADDAWAGHGPDVRRVPLFDWVDAENERVSRGDGRAAYGSGP